MSWRHNDWPAYRPRPKRETLVRDDLDALHADGRVLVRFDALGPFGTFGGTCLYALRDSESGCYTIKQSASTSIASTETWLTKRDWEHWG